MIYLLLEVFFFFFFKQKTAYEMRISDWSSDVCSSDLMAYNWLFDRLQQKYGFERTVWIRTLHAFGFEFGLILAAIPLAAWWLGISQIGRASCRERVCQYV